MAKRAGLSAEEKRIKLLQLFHETSDIFQLKDLERIAPKEKGIVRQSVKPILQELVDNGDVCSDKIAGCLFYWSFPNQVLHSAEKQLEVNEKQDVLTLIKLEALKKQLNVTSKELGDLDVAKQLTNELTFLQKERDDLKARAAQFITNDLIEKKQTDSACILEAANRWTNNIFLIKSWVKNKFNKTDDELNRAFDIPDDLDYLGDG